MRAGSLDKTITIQRSTNGVDDYGTATDTWNTVVTVKAAVIRSTTEEFLRGFGQSEEQTLIFRIRFRSSLDLGDRILFDGRAFDLKEVKELGRRQGLDLRCVAAGA